MTNRREKANAIRVLSMDAVQKANSGHPGMPMGMADIAEVLWQDFLSHNPQNPAWPNRDRFILSNGHGSMLQYALLHLTGYDVSMEDLKQFRQLHSKTPGHPEFTDTPGVETTTGPLGQGLANAVGMALAEAHLAKQFNRDHFNIVDHFTYVFLGDGCLMEGISHEVCSLAGTLKLGKLIAFWDDNHISIDGDVGGWFTDDTPERFRAYHWHVIADVDGHDAEAVQRAILEAQHVTDKPTLICCKTTIGWGSPNVAGTSKAHGAALGEAEIALTREQLQWPHAPFVIPDALYQAWDAKTQGAKHEHDWQILFDVYQATHPELAAEFMRRTQGQLPDSWQDVANTFIESTLNYKKPSATRGSSLECINAYAAHLPELLGGSADLTGSNCTQAEDTTVLAGDNPEGNYLHYGVREFGMSAIMNGLALYGGLIPFGGTFLVFSDYARNALRLAAIMRVKALFVFTHDSIGLGEDGPTHQPIEHLASLRLMPGMSVWRPCDLTESAVAWKMAIERPGPTCFAFSRQKLVQQQRDASLAANIARGGYILRDCTGTPDVIIIATGSEVEIAMEATNQLESRKIRVVSMPSTDVFDAQDDAYRESVLPSEVRARIAIEAGSRDCWYKYVGAHGKILGLDQFGASAPFEEIYAERGLDVDALVKVAETFECSIKA